MKKLASLIIFMSTMAGCSADLDRARCRGGGTTFYTESYTNVGDACEKPYVTEPQWCDYHGDGSECCVWNISDTMQEYCKWTYDTCYEFNGSFQLYSRKMVIIVQT